VSQVGYLQGLYRDARLAEHKKQNVLKLVVPKREKVQEAVEAVQLFNPENRIQF
jgi:hypothetical protein